MTEDELIIEIRKKAEIFVPMQMEILQSLCAVDSGTGNLEGNERTLEIIEKELSHINVCVERVKSPDAGSHLVARVKPEIPCKARKIIVSAHLDTVFSTGDAAKHPFRTDGEWAYGLGIADCKGGVLVSMFALRAAQELNIIPKNLEIVIIYNCDEETGSASGRSLFERERDAECAFVFEPARENNGIITSRGGCACGAIEVTGKTAHAALAYTRGADANLELARRVVSLSDKNIPDRNIFFSAGLLDGGEHVDKVSDRAAAKFFVGFSTAEDMKYISESVKALESECSTPGCTVKSSVEVFLPPMEKSEANLKLYAKLKEAGHLLGIDLPEERSAGSSDACWYASLGIPAVDALGPYMKDIHTTEEAMKIKTLKERTALFALTLAKI